MQLRNEWSADFRRGNIVAGCADLFTALNIGRRSQNSTSPFFPIFAPLFAAV
jgi:hypothetical protein